MKIDLRNGPLDEKTAIHRLKHGDPGGLEYLVRQSQVRAVRTAFLIVGDRGLAEEVVQDAFLQAFRSINGFDAARPFEPWFLRIVVNASLRLLRTARRELPLEDAGAEAAFHRLAAQVESPQSVVERNEAEAEIQRALHLLSPRQRAVIVQRYFLEMNEAEMAAASGTAAGTVKWLLNAARRRLREVLVERSGK